jgi:hypothetical protein
MKVRPCPCGNQEPYYRGRYFHATVPLPDGDYAFPVLCTVECIRCGTMISGNGKRDAVARWERFRAAFEVREVAA